MTKTGVSFKQKDNVVTFPQGIDHLEILQNEYRALSDKGLVDLQTLSTHYNEIHQAFANKSIDINTYETHIDALSDYDCSNTQDSPEFMDEILGSIRKEKVRILFDYTRGHIIQDTPEKTIDMLGKYQTYATDIIENGILPLHKVERSVDNLGLKDFRQNTWGIKEDMSDDDVVTTRESYAEKVAEIAKQRNHVTHICHLMIKGKQHAVFN